MAGKSDIPQGEGDFYATYVAAAATLAYWGLVRRGVTPRRAAQTVNENALEMICTLREEFNKLLEAEAASDDTPCDRDDSSEE